jgi:DNA-binding LacI/PurR family transcriptional regulator
MAGIGPTHRDAVEACIDELLRLGHQKITMIARKERRKPTPGIIERLLLDSLAEKGLPVTHQTLPDWEESLSGFRACLASLFEQSPPTAMIFQEPELVMAAQQFFAQQGLRIPENVSLFCCDYDPRFEWSVPTVAHSHWDYREVVQRTVDWARNVSSGKTDHEITVMRAKFAPGGTIGPPPSGSLHRGTSGEVW